MFALLSLGRRGKQRLRKLLGLDQAGRQENAMDSS